MDHFNFDPDLTLLGTVYTHAGEEPLTLTQRDRLNHTLIIGWSQKVSRASVSACLRYLLCPVPYHL